MDRKKTETIRCRNCNELPNMHNYGPYDDLLCEIERLPLQVQEMYYQPYHTHDKIRPFIIYYPMDNLQMLEYEYERSKRETPTRDSLR